MITYEQNSTAILYATFVDYKGEGATISGTPTISIYHEKSGSVITDVNNENMTPLSGSTYYYEYYIAPNSDKSTYNVKFAATYSDGISVVGDDSFMVVSSDFYNRKTGGMVQKIINRGVWTKKEKDIVLDIIIRMSNLINHISKNLNNAADIKDIKQSSKNIIMSLEKPISKLISIESKNAGAVSKLKAQLSGINKTLSDRSDADISVINEKLGQVNSKLMELSDNKPVMEINQKIISMINSLNQKISDIDESKIESYKKDMEELKSDLKDIGLMIIKSMPSDKLESAINAERSDD